MPNEVPIARARPVGPEGLTFGLFVVAAAPLGLRAIPFACTIPLLPSAGETVAVRRPWVVVRRGGEPDVCTCWRRHSRRLGRVMITTPSPYSEGVTGVAPLVAIPVTRAVGDDAREGGECSGGGRSEGGQTLARGSFGGGTASRELPEELVAAAVRGDVRARADLLALIQPLVLRYCRARLGRRETALGSADDVAQDVCMAVVGVLQTYQLKGLSFRAFVYGIAANKVTDAFRAIGRDRTDPVAELPDTPVIAEGPEDRLLDAERVAALRALLAHLTPRQREVLVLRLAVGLSADETARVVGSTPGAVRVTQHRALLGLRRMIAQGASAAAAADLNRGDAAPDAESST